GPAAGLHGLDHATDRVAGKAGSAPVKAELGDDLPPSVTLESVREAELVAKLDELLLAVVDKAALVGGPGPAPALAPPNELAHPRPLPLELAWPVTLANDPPLGIEAKDGHAPVGLARFDHAPKQISPQRSSDAARSPLL